jgi:hypothetical protein
VEGGCACGFVRYRVRGVPRDETICHCSSCRRSAGAPMVAWFTVAPGELVWTSGERLEHRSSDHGRRGFCPRCGTQLCFRSSRRPDEVDVTTASLDEPERVPPRDHTRTSSRLSWVKLADGLPCFVEERE